ncbi:MAG: tRNA pseudouridine(55) synthase TruB [Elusimicrobiota bacterium]
MDGVVNVNKPRGLTSFRTVEILKKLSSSRKAGHAGTLDPEASGVLIVLLGEACKVSGIFLGQDKTYSATVVLGYTSTTWDAAGELRKSVDVFPETSRVNDVIESFKGEYTHLVPEYSAKKSHGKTFYKIKRSGGKPPERRQTTLIHDIRLKKYTHPEITLTVNSSAGTYIRSLAVDIGQKLNTGAYLKELVRTSVGSFTVDKAVQPDTEKWEKGYTGLSDTMMKFPHIVINSNAAKRITNGICFTSGDIMEKSGDTEVPALAVFSPEGKLLSLSRKQPDGEYSLLRVFNYDSN